MTKIKICGLTNVEDARLAVELGADALGFIFTSSPRQITPHQAQEIIKEVPPFIAKVGVFKDESLTFVRQVSESCHLDYIQVHREVQPSFWAFFFPRLIQVFHPDHQDVLVKIWNLPLPFFMFDLPKEPRGYEVNSDLHRETILEAKNYGKIILAGGLNPENVEHILRNIGPYGVDVCRGVEAEVGKKSPEKLRSFILKVRKWDLQNL
ncbi:MAG: N-(5'-phosphoribosyl)anthranilate isomerase [Candidatus Zixiibacteriota bacterium]